MAGRVQGFETVLVDMDGVAADFDARVIQEMSTVLPGVAIVARANFYISDDYPEHRAVVRAISDQPGFFESLPVVDGFLEGWEEMVRLGYKPRICSSPLGSNPNCEAEKKEWIRANMVPHFGAWVLERAIIDSDKYRYDGVALIDDKPDPKCASSARWQHIVFDRPFNRGRGSYRINGWHDPHLADTLNRTRIIYRALRGAGD